jgi:hypothetical protein
MKVIARHKDIGHQKWPENKVECESYAAEWADLSGPGSMRRLQQTCIGALDGILVETYLPKKRETQRRNDYRSGHKKRIGLNVQALCDAKLRFLLISVLCPGKTNDWSAYGKSVMRNLVEALPEDFYILGDAAYVNSEHLLAPYPGKKLEGREDTFNYYQSQLRIRIEMAFAQLVGRFGIFWRPLRVPLRAGLR